MIKRIIGITGISLWLGLIAVVVGLQVTSNGEELFDKLPERWKVEKSFVVPKDQTAAISRRLGSRISRLTNTVLSVEGKSLQVNVIHCPTIKQAEKIYKAVLEAHNGLAASAVRDRNTVVEFAKSEDVELMNRARRALGLPEANLNSIAEKLIRSIPAGWKVEESFIVPKDQAAAIANKLGGRIKNLSNTIFSVQGRRFQVNVIECATPQEAEKIHNSILEMKGHPAFCRRYNNSVVEFVGDDVNLAIKAAWEFGLKPKPVQARYKISFDAAPIKKGNFLSWNKLFNLFSALNHAPDDNEIKSQITELSKKFEFGNEISLRTCGNEKAKPAYRFKPNAAKTEVLMSGDITKYHFNNLPQKAGAPFVSIEVTVTTYKGALTTATRKADNKLLRQTEFWPVNDPKIITLAQKITAGSQSQQDKVKAILEWLNPGKNIKFGGPVTGSRYGVKKVLEQHFGHCWDFSDCFITLCRSAGIPCRQVAGWLYATCGHIWAEVFYEGKGWQQVDPTGGGILKCGIYHIPYLTSEDGSMPILYISMPKIELLEP